MSTTRAVKQSLFPDMQPEKAIGPILPSVFVGSNAEMIRAAAPLYLQGSVMDCTYGEGKWWESYRPAVFVGHDLKTDGVDFTALPELDDTYDAVTFDPPYIPQGGTKDAAIGARFRTGFGLVQRSESGLWTLIEAGLTECARVVKPMGFVLVKCTDYVNGGSLTFGHVKAMEIADRVGLACHDLIVHHTGSGPGGHNIFIPKRARRHHSYLLVFTKPKGSA